MAKGFNDLDQIQKQDNNKRIIFSIIAMLLITTVVIVILFVMKDSYDRRNTPSQTESEQSDLTSSTDSSTDGVSSEESSDTASQDTSSEQSDASSDTSSEESSDTSSDDGADKLEHGWVVNSLGYTYLYYDRGLEQFTVTTNVRNSYIETINKLKSSLGSVGFYHMLVPTQVEFMDIPLATIQEDNFYNSLQQSFISTVSEYLSEGITDVNIYDSMKTAFENDDYVYFRTDINWTALAAYKAYCDFASAASFTPQASDIYPQKTYENFLGRFHTATNAQILKDNADTIVYYDVDSVNECDVTMYGSSGSVYTNRRLTYSEVSDTSNGYNVFLGADAARFKITTQQNNGKRILVIGDTSAKPFVAFLTSEYQEIHLVNPQYYKGNIAQFAAENGITDVLVMSYTTNASKLFYQGYFENLYAN